MTLYRGVHYQTVDWTHEARHYVFYRDGVEIGRMFETRHRQFQYESYSALFRRSSRVHGISEGIDFILELEALDLMLDTGATRPRFREFDPFLGYWFAPQLPDLYARRKTHL